MFSSLLFGYFGPSMSSLGPEEQPRDHTARRVSTFNFNYFMSVRTPWKES